MNLLNLYTFSHNQAVRKSGAISIAPFLLKSREKINSIE